MSGFSLFYDFLQVSVNEWKQKIETELKSVDDERALVWKSQEGIAVKPFYHRENSVATIIRKKKKGWLVGQSIEVEIAEDANKKALDAIGSGAECIWFNVTVESIDCSALLKAIPLKTIEIHICFQVLSDKTPQLVLEFSKTSKNIQFYFDVLGNLAKTGNWHTAEKADFGLLHKLLEITKSKTITVNVALYQNSGATIIQQLAYALAHVNEYLHHFNSDIQKIVFKIAVGSNYFFEIAKLRALRLLWAVLAAEYGLKEDCFIIAMPSKRNKTLYNYNVNMLRSTTECMAAVLGGADIICNLSYDVMYHKPNTFGNRIAINQLLLLKHEAYFDVVDNAAEGAYYIESLTQELAEKALELFKNIEAEGGYLAQLKSGMLQREIVKSAKIEKEQFNANEVVLVGVNKYQNIADKMKKTINNNPFKKAHCSKTLIKPIVEQRLAEEVERQRMNDE